MNYIIESLGYIGSIFVILAFIFTDIRKVRIVNAIGCIIYIIYAITLKLIPVIIPNLFILFIQIYHLYIRKNYKDNK